MARALLEKASTKELPTKMALPKARCHFVLPDCQRRTQSSEAHRINGLMLSALVRLLLYQLGFTVPNHAVATSKK